MPAVDLPAPTGTAPYPRVEQPADVEFWMDDDAARAAAATGPPRDVPTPRPVPRPTTRRADLERAWTVPDPRSEADAPEESDDEPAWLRERREEAEFEAEFGSWRAGPVGMGALPPRRSPLARLPLLLLVIVVALVLWSALVP
jgi:hypothetical protein